MNGVLADKAVLLTGGNGRIWHLIVKELLAGDAKLEFTFRSDSELNELFAFIRKYGLPHMNQPCIPILVNDVYTTQLDWAPAAVQRDFMRLEYLVNLFEDPPVFERLLEKTLPLMEARGTGCVVYPQNLEEIFRKMAGKGIQGMPMDFRNLENIEQNFLKAITPQIPLQSQ